MIIFAELFMTGAQHAAFNAAMLQVWHKAYPQEELVFYTSKNHWQVVQEHLRETILCDLKIIQIVANKTGSKRTWAKKFANESFQLIKVLRQAHKYRPTYLCFSFLSPVGLYLLTKYLNLFSIKSQVLVILHGLEILKPAKRVKTIDKVYARLISHTFQHSVSNIQYFVLEQSAKEYLVKNNLIDQSKVTYLPHPYIFPTSITHRSESNSLKLGHIGMARLDKQSNKFFELAAYFKDAVIAEKVSFQVVGSVLPEMKPFLNKYVQFPSEECMLDRASYEAGLQALDYVVFCYADDTYELTSSGALMDAIAYQKPILALRNKSFEQVFQLAGAKPGYLFDDMASLTAFIQQLIIQPIDNHIFKSAFLALQDHYSIVNVASLLKQILARNCQQNN